VPPTIRYSAGTISACIAWSFLPPYNMIECQIVATNRLVTNGTGYTIVYEAIADPAGSFNSTSGDLLLESLLHGNRVGRFGQHDQLWQHPDYRARAAECGWQRWQSDLVLAAADG